MNRVEPFLNSSRMSHKFPSTTGRGEVWMSTKLTNPNATRAPLIRLRPQPRQDACCLGVRMVLNPQRIATMPHNNNAKKLMPTISSARTAHLPVRPYPPDGNGSDRCFFGQHAPLNNHSSRYPFANDNVLYRVKVASSDETFRRIFDPLPRLDQR